MPKNVRRPFTRAPFEALTLVTAEPQAALDAENWVRWWLSRHRRDLKDLRLSLQGAPQTNEPLSDRINQRALSLDPIALANQFSFALFQASLTAAPAVISCSTQEAAALRERNGVPSPDDPERVEALYQSVIQRAYKTSARHIPSAMEMAQSLLSAGFSWSLKLQMHVERHGEVRLEGALRALIERQSIDASASAGDPLIAITARLQRPPRL